MEMGWCEQSCCVMYFNERGLAALLASWDIAAAKFLACPGAKKNAPDGPTPRSATEHHRAEVRQKEAINRLKPAQTCVAVDVHSGGQDWHPSAGMRYRLRKSEKA